MRSEPPVSEPVQTGSMSVASATAEPPDEPPGLSIGLNGLPVAPHTDVAAVGAGAELRHVGLGDDDGAGLPHARHHGVVVLGHDSRGTAASRRW